MKIYSIRQMWQELQSTRIGMEHAFKMAGKYDEVYEAYKDQYNILCLVSNITWEEEEILREHAVLVVAHDRGCDRVELPDDYWKAHEEINEYCMRGY